MDSHPQLDLGHRRMGAPTCFIIPLKGEVSNQSLFSMKITSLLQRLKAAFQRSPSMAGPQGAHAAGQEFIVTDMLRRLERLQPPQAQEHAPQRLHALIKLVPIPLPRAVRWEGHVMHALAWLGTAALAWGGFVVPTDWLLWYGLGAVLVFALLFRLEGPRTRAERLSRQAAVDWYHSRYQEAQAHLQEVLHQRFASRMQDFYALRHLYDVASQAIDAVETASASALHPDLAGIESWEQQLAQEVETLEAQMRAVVDELEDFSQVHKQEIDAAIMARHDARLAYWQARLDTSLFTGESVQHQHP